MITWNKFIERVREGKMNEKVRIQAQPDVLNRRPVVPPLADGVATPPPAGVGTITELDAYNLVVVIRGFGTIASEFELAIKDIEELYNSEDAHYAQWLIDNDERLRASARRDLHNKTSDAVRTASRLQSELESTNNDLVRRFSDIRSKLQPS